MVISGTGSLSCGEYFVVVKHADRVIDSSPIKVSIILGWIDFFINAHRAGCSALCKVDWSDSDAVRV